MLLQVAARQMLKVYASLKINVSGFRNHIFLCARLCICEAIGAWLSLRQSLTYLSTLPRTERHNFDHVWPADASQRLHAPAGKMIVTRPPEQGHRNHSSHEPQLHMRIGGTKLSGALAAKASRLGRRSIPFSRSWRAVPLRRPAESPDSHVRWCGVRIPLEMLLAWLNAKLEALAVLLGDLSRSCHGGG